MTTMTSTAALQRLTMQELRVRYAELFGETTSAKNRTWLLRRVAWRLQTLAEGDLSERARQRAGELANDADLRITAPRVKEPVPVAQQCAEPAAPARSSDSRLPMPGTVLMRDYKGQTVQVEVLAEGFAYAGQSYKSLSAVAKAVTGAHCNGFHFFRCALAGRGGAA